MQTINSLSPAKINLFLHITGRRPDGYHELQTLFQLLDLADKLRFEWLSTPDIIVICDHPELTTENNLITRAARLLQEQYSVPHGVKIYLEKIIPMGAGLGGGSSNAATTLLVLNDLWKLGLPQQKLIEIGLTLGADVPVFIMGETAFAEGIGDKLTPMPTIESDYLLLYPHCHIATADIFTHPDLIRNHKKITKSHYDFQTTNNDCETIVRKLEPKVDSALEARLEYLPSRMTGTGSCIFAPIYDKSILSNIVHQIDHLGDIFITRGINISSAYPFHFHLK